MELTEDRVREWLPKAKWIAANQCIRLGLREWADEAESQSLLLLWRYVTAYDPARNNGDMATYLEARINWGIKDFLRDMRLTSRASLIEKRPPLLQIENEKWIESVGPRQIDTQEFLSPAIVRALESLDPREREILEDVAIHGLLHREVAVKHGICESRVSQLYSQARANMRKRLVN